MSRRWFLLARACGLMLALTALLQAQKKEVTLLVVDRHLRGTIRTGLEKGLQAGLASASEAGRLVVAGPGELRKPGTLQGCWSVLLFLPPPAAARAAALAERAHVLVMDLGQAGLRGKSAPPQLALPWKRQAEDAAWWLTGPFAHHHVAVFHGHGRESSRQARAFVDSVQRDPRRHATHPARMPTSLKGARKKLLGLQEKGVTGCYCIGTLEEGRVVAQAARTLHPPLVVVLSSKALGAARDKNSESPLLPPGTVVMDRDLPGPEVFKAHSLAASLLAMEGEGGPWALLGYEALLVLDAARKKLRGGNPSCPLGELLEQGQLPLLRPLIWGGKAPLDPRSLVSIPLIMSGGRLVPFPPADPLHPRQRPRRLAYDPEKSSGGFARWSTLTHLPRSGMINCLFTFSSKEERTIEDELTALKLISGGEQPLVDHLVREKLLARTMAITGAKFGLREDGGFRQGSFLIGMTAALDKRRGKPSRVWRVIIAGDDPEAGGRAFGSYCRVFSRFIYRTIFQRHRLLDEPMGLAELSRLTGLGVRDKDIQLGSRGDVLYRLIDRFAGSMALTAAHEIGHLCGLGHDTEDPRSIMNVREGAGLDYPLGRFIPRHRAQLARTLGLYKGS